MNDTITELQGKIATQQKIIRNLNDMNDTLQAKLNKIDQIVKDSGNFKGENTAHDKYVKIAEIILEQE